MDDLMRLLMPSRASLMGTKCPGCGGRAECVVPNFYVCGTPGCANGPPRPDWRGAAGHAAGMLADVLTVPGGGTWAYMRSYTLATARAVTMAVDELWEPDPGPLPRLVRPKGLDRATLHLAGLGQFTTWITRADGGVTKGAPMACDLDVYIAGYARLEVRLLAAGGGELAAWER